MLELLKRFEEESAESEDINGEEDEEESGLSERISSIDLGASSVGVSCLILNEYRHRICVG